MCGRYAVDPRKLDRLVRLLSLPLPDFPAHYDIRPSQTVPVIRDTGNGPEWASMRWGLIPHWAKEAKTGYSTFNTRIETAAQKPRLSGTVGTPPLHHPRDGFLRMAATGNRQEAALVLREHRWAGIGFGGPLGPLEGRRSGHRKLHHPSRAT